MEKPHISSPCSVDYNKMSPTDSGRFCENCCKIVVDFTTKTAQQISDFLKINSGTCGRFRKSQLEPIPVESNRKFSKRFSLFSVALYFVFGTLLFSVEGCFMGEAAPKRLMDSTRVADSLSRVNFVHKTDSLSDSTKVNPH